MEAGEDETEVKKMMANPQRPFWDRLGIHYGWVIVATGVAVIFACIGLGRFALGMLLPAMGAALGLSYSQMGLISTANFVGYMVAVALTAALVKRWGARQVICLGLTLVGISMVAIKLAGSFGTVLVLYTATGAGSGFANIPMLGLMAYWFARNQRGRAAGTMLAGNGIAIVAVGLFVPFVNLRFGVDGWRVGWLAMGAATLLIAVASRLLLRNDPLEMGLRPLGQTESDQTCLAPNGQAVDCQTSRAPTGTLLHLGLIYAMFGATYAVYTTFIVTSMVAERGFAENLAGNFWAVVGGLSICSGTLFGWVSDRLGRQIGIIVVFTLFTVAYGMVALDGPLLFLYLSIGVFGLTVWSVPPIMAAAVGDYTGPDQAVKAFGFVTLVFCGGQIVGPVAAGYVAEWGGTFRFAFGLCAGLTSAAVIMALFLRRPPENETPPAT